MLALDWLLIALVLLGALPLAAGCYQFALAGLHWLRRDGGAAPFHPRVAVVIPAWNEVAVIGRTLDALAALRYPRDALRVYVVDDGSTDGTGDAVEERSRAHPELVFLLRRPHGGQGKAHTLNHGLLHVAREGWFDAVLIIDADVLVTPDALAHLTRHLATPGVGAVTAYIKEGSRPGTFLSRFIAFEYVTAQAAGRRALNLLGVQACLAGGAQLISRESLEALGGEIDVGTLAEDTVTTFRIQLAGARVVFDPHALVWAEEPRDVRGLWRQRLRWGRGNFQVTERFWRVWLRPWRHRGLGGLSFALIWFTTAWMPVFLVVSSAALYASYFVDRPLSTHVFQGLWAINLGTYVFVTLSSFSIDAETARRAWPQGLLFPGAVSLLLMQYAIYPPLDDQVLAWVLGAAGAPSLEPVVREAVLLFAYAWLTGGMVAGFLIWRLELWGRAPWLVAPLVYAVGYGPMLCAITAVAHLKELRQAEARWEKTEKTGTGAALPAPPDPAPEPAAEGAALVAVRAAPLATVGPAALELRRERRWERDLLLRQVGIAVLLALLVAARAVLV